MSHRSRPLPEGENGEQRMENGRNERVLHRYILFKLDFLGLNLLGKRQIPDVELPRRAASRAEGTEGFTRVFIRMQSK